MRAHVGRVQRPEDHTVRGPPPLDAEGAVLKRIGAPACSEGVSIGVAVSARRGWAPGSPPVDHLIRVRGWAATLGRPQCWAFHAKPGQPAGYSPHAGCRARTGAHGHRKEANAAKSRQGDHIAMNLMELSRRVFRFWPQRGRLSAGQCTAGSWGSQMPNVQTGT